MKMKIINTLVILALVISLPVIATSSAYTSGSVTAKDPIAIGAMERTGEHLVMPRDEIILEMLEDVGVVTFQSSPDEIQEAIDDWKLSFAKKSDTWVNADMEKKALAREEQLANASSMAPQVVQPVDVTVFTMAIDFEDTPEDVTYQDLENCDTGGTLTTSFAGPLAGNMPYPDPADNNTIWYDPDDYADDPTYYNQLIYGYAGVGRIRADEAALGETGDDILTDPRDGLPGINLAGYTVQDYYDHVAGEGNVTLDGNTFGWVTVPHPEAYYGADSCSGSHHGGAIDEFGNPVYAVNAIMDAVEIFNADNPGFNWAEYDSNGDQYIDTFWVIHAGMGQEGGGGAQGAFSLWSHSSDARYYILDGVQVAGLATPDDPSDDIFVGPYTVQPENADVGVMTEEFGHNVFGLPDLYVTDVQGSIAFWSTMESGSWGGYLGGATPVSMPLWFKMIAWCGIGPCNWQYPMITRAYDDLSEDVTLRQLEVQEFDATREDWGPTTPTAGTYKGVRINLPDVVTEIPNNAGTGNAAWSGLGNDADFTVERTIAVPAVGTNELTFGSYWDIEEDYDYGYVQVNDGSGWVSLPDLDSYFKLGALYGYSLTGFGSDMLAFDLSAYAGTSIGLRFRYVTDPGVNGDGWWIDDVMLDSVLIDDFETSTPPDSFSGWDNAGWSVAPYTDFNANYYLVEWRNATKYDQMVQTAYVTTDSDDNLWEVERVPYNIPGALVYYRNTAYTNTYAQYGNYGDPPSYGPKYQLLLVDMNPTPVPVGSFGETGYFFNPRVGSYDAALTLDSTDYWEVSAVYGVPNPGPFEYPSKPPVTDFNDSLRYYAGFRYNPSTGGIGVPNDSAVIPARDLYSVAIWNRNTGNLMSWWQEEYAWEKLYEQTDPSGLSWLGNGAPGYDNVQHGVNVELLSVAEDGEYGVLRFYNYSVDFPTTVSGERVLSDFVLTTVTEVTNQGPRNAYDAWTETYLDTSVCFDETMIEVTAVSSLGGELPFDLIEDAPGEFLLIWGAPGEGLAPDETVTLTATCTVPLASVGDYSFDTETYFIASDGHVERAGKIIWTENYINRYTFPLMMSPALP
jgi:immune inhibitor A